MEESRDALAQKIEMLEEKVTETVQSASASVAEATASVLETVQNATASVSDTVDTVTSAVQGTVDSVRQSMEGTVDSVKSAFDVNLQFQQHPWWMFAGAVAAGYCGGLLLQESPCARERSTSSFPSGPVRAKDTESRYASTQSASSLNGREDRVFTSSSAPASSGWLQQLGQAFGPEIAKLEGLAIGVALGSVRDFIVDAVPPAVRPQVSEVIDGFTHKLGGQRIEPHQFSSDVSSDRTGEPRNGV